MDRVYVPRMDCSAISTYISALFVFLLYFTITMPYFRPYGIALCILTVALYIAVLRTYYNRLLYRRHLNRQVARELRARRRLNANDIELLRCFRFANVSVTSSVDAVDSSKSTEISSDSSQVGCVVCLCDYAVNEVLLQLPCGHCYHKACIAPWLRRNARCPICKMSVSPPAVPVHPSIVLVEEAPVDSGEISQFTGQVGSEEGYLHHYNCSEMVMLAAASAHPSSSSLSVGDAASVESINPLISNSLDSMV